MLGQVARKRQSLSRRKGISCARLRKVRSWTIHTHLQEHTFESPRNSNRAITVFQHAGVSLQTGARRSPNQQEEVSFEKTRKEIPAESSIYFFVATAGVSFEPAFCWWRVHSS